MKSYIRFFVLTLLSLGAVITRPAQAAVVVWTNTSGGAWNAAANWSPNSVPGSSDAAVITNAGTYTVTLDSSFAVAALTLGTAGSSGNQTLLWSSGTLSGCNLTIAASGILNLSGAGEKGLVQSVVNNGGRMVWTGSGPLIAQVTGPGQSVLITNLAGGWWSCRAMRH